MRLEAPQSLRELEVRAEALEGRTVAEVASALAVPVPTESRRAKGFVGTLVELALGADPRAGDGPDFPALAVELKTIPILRAGRPVESTFCCTIAMAMADAEEWATSRLRKRLQRVLWMPVEAQPQVGDRRFARARLWTPSDEEMDLLRADWEDLMGAVGAGRAPSAHEGRVLQIRPKAKSRLEQTLAPGEDGPALALPLGFYLRARFTGAILACGNGARGLSLPTRDQPR
ncbi:MutH/Sau3AI family endonuclease [Myxococcota bacterium]